MTRHKNHWAALTVAAALTAALTSQIQAAPDKREMQAREDFAAGRYQDALDIFVKLYAEKLHPVYLRNIGRCYQNLGDADKAISAFREYLRKGKGISADERAEVDGYIKEMEDLAARKQGQAAPPTENPPPVTPLPAASAATPPSNATTTTPALTLQASPPPPAAPESSSPFYTRWWFWAIVGGVVVAGVGGMAAGGVFTSHKDAACDPGRICP
jgi:hypothetical protein